MHRDLLKFLCNIISEKLIGVCYVPITSNKLMTYELKTFLSATLSKIKDEKLIIPLAYYTKLEAKTDQI